jgi:hypothetical protein
MPRIVIERVASACGEACLSRAAHRLILPTREAEMFRCSPLRIRELSFALLLLVSSTFSIDATADSGNYRVRAETLRTGVRVSQQVDTVTFPLLKGTLPTSSSADAPGVASGRLRAVRGLLPRKGNIDFGLALPDGSAYIKVDFYNHAVAVGYGGSSITEASAPFWEKDKHELKWEGSAKRRWSQIIPIGPRLSATATHFLVTLYVLPRLDEASQTDSGPNLVLTVHEAVVQGMNIVRGRSLADNVALAVNEDDWSKWRGAALRAGSISESGDGPLALPAAFTSRLPFVEQRTMDLREDASGLRRDKRCVTDALYQISNLLLPAILDFYFSRPDLCSLDPHPNQNIAEALPLVEVADQGGAPRFNEATVFEASSLQPEQFGATASFDAAMNIQFCNTNHLGSAGDEACSDADNRAIAAIGELTPRTVDELLARIASMYEPDRQGPATLRTGNSELDRWLNADLVRAENALNAARAVVHVSDARAEPTEPIKNKKKRKRKLVKASCIETKETGHAEGDGFQQCVRKARRRLGETGLVVALPPLVESNERHYLRGTPGFERLVREFRNSGRGMPWGIRDEQFSQFTAAIARDRAPTGDNVGIVFINDPALRTGGDRFRYGVEHIWAPGAGGGDNAGHRDDWRALAGLPVNGRELLIEIVMAALTDPQARFKQTRSHKGHVVRTFEYFVLRRGNAAHAIKNVRIVLGQNGMIITAYPLANARAEPLFM